MSVAGLVLAAGAGTRFGGPKALAEFGTRTLVEHGIRELDTAGAQPIHVVLGAEAQRVLATANLTGARAVVNPDWATGIGSSLRAGLDSMPAEVEAVIITLVDQPLVGTTALRRLRAAYADGSLVAAASYQGLTRNPVLLARTVWDAVAARAQGETGARGYLRSHPETVTAVPCDDVGTPADIDTPGDLETLHRIHNGENGKDTVR